MGLAIATPVVILLGAILASPIRPRSSPCFRPCSSIAVRPRTVVAESALNDVVGTLLTSAFFKLPLAALTVTAAYGALATPQNYRFLAEQTDMVCCSGSGVMRLWILAQIKRRHSIRYGADQVYFLAAPIIAFTGATALAEAAFSPRSSPGSCSTGRNTWRRSSDFSTR